MRSQMKARDTGWITLTCPLQFMDNLIPDLVSPVLLPDTRCVETTVKQHQILRKRATKTGGISPNFPPHPSGLFWGWLGGKERSSKPSSTNPFWKPSLR